MAYTAEEQIVARLPRQHLVDALDDDGDGQPDDGLMAAVIAGAAQQVDAFLSSLFTVPFADPAPAAVAEAALCFVLEDIYARRGATDKENPWTKKADAHRAKLKAIGEGKAPLEATAARATAPGIAIVEDARTMGDRFL